MVGGSGHFFAAESETVSFRALCKILIACKSNVYMFSLCCCFQDKLALEIHRSGVLNQFIPTRPSTSAASNPL
jgi:hypothetical protein